jgi:myo-inositol-1(or 4)-monophosphatase
VQGIKQVAFTAARQAGAILRERLGKIHIDYKSAFNLVTEADKESEQHVISVIRDRFPNDQILAEETGAHQTSSTRRWIIDPLDGTTNYAHTYPFFSVSIGFEDKGDVLFGVVYNPSTDELFWAEKGQGAYLNDRRISVSNNATLNVSLLATGFPPDSRTAPISNLDEFAHITDLSHGVRRDASAALDLSFVASGRLDGFWELKLAPWDLAAGTLLIREAGGTVTNAVGGKFDIGEGHVIATNGKIHDELVRELNFASKLVKVPS